jgi:RNA polymerase sigma-70 factor (ECF subfamily)
MLFSFDQQEVEPARIVTSPADEPSDEQLMARVQQRDEAALEMIFRRHMPLLRTVVHRVVNNDTDSDDLLQEVYYEVWRQAEHYSAEKGKALSWLVTLARRRSIDRLRKKLAYQRAEERLLHETEHNAASGPLHGVEEDAAASERAEILQRVIRTLPEAQRDALNLAFYRGMSQREIAAQTGIPLGTIKTRLELAVRKVKTAILAIGGLNEWDPARAE